MIETSLVECPVPGSCALKRTLRSLIVVLVLVAAPTAAQPDVRVGLPVSEPQAVNGSISWGLVDSSHRVVVNLSGPQESGTSKVFGPGDLVELDLLELGNLPDGKYSYTVRTVPNEGDQTGFVSRYASGAVHVSGGLIEGSSTFPEPVFREGTEPSQGAGLHTKTSPEIADVGTVPFLRLEDTTPQGVGTEDDWWILVDQFGAGDGDEDFSIGWQNDTSGGTITYPFVIGNSINNNALYLLSRGVASTTEIGLNTGSPAATLHLASNFVPDIRFEDVGSNPYQWEIEADSGSFSVEDVTAATLPLVVEAGAPSSSLRIDSAGSLGIGTAQPSATVEIEGSSGTSQLLVDEQAANASVEVMFNLVCNCSPGFRMENTVNGEVWFFRHTAAGDFAFDNVAGSGLEARLDASGNFFIRGSLSQGSSRSLKENVSEVPGAKVLELLEDVDLYEWSYLDQKARHFGPMAEQFSSAFGLGESRSKIAPSDMAGVALAGVKELRERNAALEDRVRRLEALLLAQLDEGQP